jgi:hypothetical protein
MWRADRLAILTFGLALLPVAGPAKTFTLTVQRLMTCNDGATGGALFVAGREVARTLELPLRNDEQFISRVKAGVYPARVRTEGTKGWRIELLDVPNHDDVQLHIGNFPSDTQGCILVGTEVKEAPDPASGKKTCTTQGSATALAKIRAEMQAASDDSVSSQALDITVEIKD